MDEHEREDLLHRELGAFVAGIEELLASEGEKVLEVLKRVSPTTTDEDVRELMHGCLLGLAVSELGTERAALLVEATLEEELEDCDGCQFNDESPDTERSGEES